jgi:MFS family permease
MVHREQTTTEEAPAAGGTTPVQAAADRAAARAPVSGPSDGPAPPRSRSLLASLSIPEFRWLFASNNAFFLAMSGQSVLRSWLVFQLTGNELALGLISALVAVPMLLMAPVGGAFADRYDRRLVVAAGQLLVIGGELTVFALLVSDQLAYWHLLVMEGLMGTAFPLIMPARQAIVANTVGRSRLTNAMALNMAAVSTTRVIGPALAGFAIARIGIARAYGANVILFVTALVCLFGVNRALPSGERRSMAHSMKEGVRYVGSDRLVRVLLFFGLVPMFLVMPFQNLLVVFADKVWEVGPEGLGILSASAGAGGLIGAVMVAWRSDNRRLRSMMLSAVAFGALLFAFALSPWYALALPLVFLANIFASYYGTANNTAIQMLVPDAVRGRVSSLLMMSFALPLLGTLPLSAAARLWGAPAAVAGASMIAVLIAFGFYFLSPSLRSMDDRLRRAAVIET